MENILNNAENAQRLLSMTTGTLILLDDSGICVDVQIKEGDPWFMKEENLKGKNLFSLLPPETYQAFYPHFREVQTLKRWTSHNYQITLNGETFYFHCTMQPYDHLILCQYKDITEYSMKHRELGRRNKELTENQKVALLSNWIYDTHTNEIHFNGHTGVFTSLDKGNINVEMYRKYIIHEDLQSFDKWSGRVLKGDLTDTLNYRISYKRHIHHFRVKCYSREKQKDGNIILEGYVQNITEIQQNRNDITLLTNAINNASESIFAADESGNLIFANRSYLDLHHMSFSKKFSNHKIYGPDYYFKDRKEWKNFVKEVKEELWANVILRNPVPERPEVTAMEISTYWITDDKGKGSIWSFGKDVSEREKIRQELIEAKEKAESSDKLKSAFLANMSHEIRTPLNAIVGFSRIIGETVDPEERNTYIRIVEENNERLLKLVSEILDISKVEANMMEFVIRPLSMYELCQDIQHTFRFRCPEAVQLVFEPSDPQLHALADSSRVVQIVSNLINNALKFTTSGSIRYGYRPKDGQVEVYVTDTGKGIPADKIGHIFDRFVKGSDSVQGTGLGLAICKILVEKMNGQIQVHSEEGKGATFTFTLPLDEKQTNP